MSPWYFVTALLLLLFNTSYSETVDCGQTDCSCNNKNESCNLECLSWRNCKDRTLTCSKGYPCNIDCASDNEPNVESCRNATINSNNATNLTILCSDWHDCGSATINCENAATCNVVCQSFVSTSQICQGLTLNCGTSQCSITCDDNSGTCSNIHVDTSTAYSFQCIGSNESCLSAPNAISPQTISPTIQPTIQPTIVPTFSPTFLPTIVPTLSPTIVPTMQPKISATILPTVSQTMQPTQSINTSTPSPILRIHIPQIIQPSTSNSNTSSTVVFDLISTENINVVIYDESTDSLVVALMNNLLLSILLCGVIIFAICLCMICYCCIEQRSKNENVQMKRMSVENAETICEGKKRVHTQSHISFSMSPNYNYDEFGFQHHISASFNALSLISPSSMVNISPHLPLPISPINEYKEQHVSPILSLNYNPDILPAPPSPSENDNDNDNVDMEGMDKENITMILNEKFIINEHGNEVNEEEEKEKEVGADGYDEIMITTGNYNINDNPNIRDDEFIIEGDDDTEFNETCTAGINYNEDDIDLSIEIEDDMISVISNVSEFEDGLIGKRKNKNLNFEMEPIVENVYHDEDVKQQNVNVISL